MARGYPGTYKRYNCIVCSKETKWGPSKKNLYCSNICQGTAQRKQILSRWLNGDYKNLHGKFPGVAKDFIFNKQGKKCALCHIESIWNGKPLTFQADHIDGDPSNLQVKNLRIICPNCHSQTDTWGKKLKNNKQDHRNSYRRKKYSIYKS